MTTVFVLMENERHEGGTPRGVYTTREKAEEEQGEDRGITVWSIVRVELDAPQQAGLPTIIGGVEI